MTREDIIRMARDIATQASRVGPYRTWTHEYAMSQIMGLVDGAVAAEREACAKICEEPAAGYWGAEACAKAIRARGKQ